MIILTTTTVPGVPLSSRQCTPPSPSSAMRFRRQSQTVRLHQPEQKNFRSTQIDLGATSASTAVTEKDGNGRTIDKGVRKISTPTAVRNCRRRHSDFVTATTASCRSAIVDDDPRCLTSPGKRVVRKNTKPPTLISNDVAMVHHQDKINFLLKKVLQNYSKRKACIPHNSNVYSFN